MSSTDSSAAPSTVSAPVRAPTLTLSAAETAFMASTTINARRTPAERVGSGVGMALLARGGVSIGRIVRSLYEPCNVTVHDRARPVRSPGANARAS